MPHPSSETADTTTSAFRARPRRWLLLLGLAAASFALVACNGDDGDDGLDGLNGANGDTTPTTVVPTPDGNGDDTPTTTPTETETATATTTPSDGEGGNGVSGDSLQVEMVDIDYSESAITATAGEELTIEFDNTGALEHTFTITDIDADVDSEFQTDEYDIDLLLQPGESGTLTFTPNEAGEYEFWCTIAGHREAGMVGTLTVEEGN